MARQHGTGAVRKLPSGRWQARFRGTDGVLRAAPMTYANRKDAETWLKVQDADVARGTWRPPATDNTTSKILLRDFGRDWIESRRGKTGEPLRLSTRKTYLGQLQLIEPALGKIALANITPAMVSKWYSGLDPAHASRNVNTYKMLKSMMESARKNRAIAENPCTEKYTRPSRRKEIKIATPDEVITIANNVQPRLRAAVIIAAWTGVRQGELRELRRMDVNLKHGTLNIQRAVSRSRDENGKYIVGEPKTEAGKRVVNIPPHIMPDVEQHLKKFVGKSPDSLLFPAVDGITHIAPSSLHGDAHKGFGFYHARLEAGRPDLRWHDLRHTGATMAARAGATTADLMRRVGHTTAQVAMIYQHSDEQRDAEIAVAMSALVDG